MKNIDILIYFEHVVRELDACMRLRFELEKIGFSVIIASVHFDKYNVLRKYRPKLVVLPFFYKDRDFPVYHLKKLYGDVEVVNLHQEQFYNDATKKLMIPQSEITKSVYHIAWSMSFADDLKEAGILSSLVRITGNPRTDNYYLNTPLLTLNKQDKKIIFIPTSFSWYFVESSYFLKNPATNPDSYYKQRELTEKSARAFFSIIRGLAKAHKDYIFVLRPHPFDPLEAFEGLLQEVEPTESIESNIIINREGNVYEWIKVSSFVISWISTVALEATLFGKNNIILQPIELPNDMQTSFISKYDHIYRSQDEVELLLSGKTVFDKNDEVKRFAEESLGIADGKVNIRIAMFIKEIFETKHKLHQTVNVAYLFVIFMKSILIDASKSIIKKLGLVSKLLSFYSNIQEDLKTVAQVELLYKNFKNQMG